MEEIPSSDGADLPLREKSGDGDLSDAFLEGSAIVVRFAEQSFAATAATEQQRAKRRSRMFRAISCQQEMQILAGGLRVAQMELDGLPFLHDVADRNGPGFLIRSHEVAHEEISSPEAAPVFIDHDPDMERSVGVAPLRWLQRFEDRLQPL